MLETRIIIDGKSYLGETEEVYQTNEGGNGWQPKNHNQLSTLSFGDGYGMVIVGVRNLKSHLDKILKRVMDGQLEFCEINIVQHGRIYCPDCQDTMSKIHEENNRGEWVVRWTCSCGDGTGS